MNNNLRKAIQQILLAGSVATFSAGAFAAVGQQNPPPGPGHIPDYFGVVPNFANSPQPVLTQAKANTGSAVQPGSGASATYTLGAGGSIANITPNPATGSGSGYVTPKVTITDQGIGTGAAVTVTTTATSGGALAGTYSLTSAGSDCAVGTPLTISGNGAAEVSAVDLANGGIVTGITVTNVGSGYTGAVSFTVNCTTANAQGTLDVTPGTPGSITGVTVDQVNGVFQGGANYSPNAKVVFIDPNRVAAGNTDAAAHVTVDATGAITGVIVDTAGTGYTASTTAQIQDVGTGTGATATATAKKVGTIPGVITAIKVTAPGTGYRNPLIEITDANAGAAGQGAVLAATTYNYATDIMTDTVIDVQVLTPGSGYDAGTIVNITGGLGSVPVSVTPIIVNGSIVGIEGIDIPDPNSATGYKRDPNFIGLNSGNGLGSGFKTPIAGTGIRKFVDSLPLLDTPNNLGQQMPVAVADIATFPDSDYYEIAEVEYTQKLHSDLPPTRLRGYVQIKAGGFTIAGFNAAADKLAYASTYAGYLGPVIVAQKDRAVRIKLVNLLPTGAAGKLPIPVDTTYMGADGPTDTDNRAALHLHGGNTPWISDGTPRQWVKPAGEAGSNKGETARNVPDMWFDASGNVVPAASVPADPVGAGLSNNPGDGTLTFYYTNEQSARLMFYHDHAEGTTRLNVYAGVAAGYILQDKTEQDLVNGTNNSGNNPSLAQVLPVDQIPLVIQEKTFVPDDSNPVLNFYGPFKSQLNSQDPTWRWGTGTPVTGLMGNGDLWVPHVFMPNQNPGDITGANAVGRWDYGPWFWPPFTNLQNGEINNPYYDPNCSTTTSYCENMKIPGVPNGSLQGVLSNGVLGGVHDATHGGAITESPSGTPEAFNDTPLVNGTVYPYINVDPKQYRLRILSVGNDRALNLSLLVASSKNSDTTADGNMGATSQAATDALCDGTAPASSTPADCTEVRMLPFDGSQHKITKFPATWYSKQKGGISLDGRAGGVFDPKVRGPQMVQIGTEGGFLSSPVAISNQPVNYEYNPKNILITNVKEHALLLGPAERADVLVDFSKFAGSTLILYNDGPAPIPAWDLRLDYYTGNFDNTDTGGAFSVIPGYGPNSRTLMQFRVATSCVTGVPCSSSHVADDIGAIDMTALTPAIQTAFKTSQEPIIVPQSAYNTTYGINATDALGQDLSRIADNQLSYWPLETRAFPYLLMDTTNPANKITLELEPKTIIEDWTMNWGRMNALLGTEIPRTTATVQTSIPQAFVDPPTDLVKITPNDNMVPISGTLPDGTQIWKITHNGVDTHAVHFHLFHVQLVNRVGWDGAVYPPEANELGWKDTVRTNPLSDTVVALRPMKMTNLPFKVPNSHRLINPSVNADPRDFFNLNPITGNASDVTNKEVNYGWEYLWHCHILGHEENDMMRTIAVAQPPEAPTGLTATTGANGVDLAWTDNSIISNWVEIQRSTNSAFNPANAPVDTINVVQAECNNQAGCARTYTDTGAPVGTTVYYRIKANNTVGAGDGKLDTPRLPDGSYGATLPPELSSLTPGFAGYAHVTANSDWSNTGSRLTVPTATVTAGPLSFGNQLINTPSVAQQVTVTNSGTGNLAITGVALSPVTNYAISNNTCPVSPAVLAPGAGCSMNVTFTPTALGALPDTLTITDNNSNVAGSTQTVSLTGNGVAPIANLPATPLAFGPVNVGSASVAQAVTLSNTGTAPLSISGITTSAQFAQTNNCGNSLAVGANCTINVTFAPTSAGATAPGTVLTVNDNSNGTASSQSVSLSGTGVAVGPIAPSNVAIQRSGTTAAILSWTDASNNETSFQAQTSTDGGTNWTNVGGAIARSAAQSTATGGIVTSNIAVTNTTNALYRVNAINATGTTSSAAVSLNDTVAPVAPTGLTGSKAALNLFGIRIGTTVTLNWADVPNNNATYQLQRSTDNGVTWNNVGAVLNGNVSRTRQGILGLTATTNLYRVQASNSVGSSLSNTFTIVTP